ncbi:Hsp20 family protein [Dongia sp. agr-C8]
MRTTFDFSPLFRSTVGFDRILDLLDNATRLTQIDNWPAYDIEKVGDDDYRITLAVAGFGESDLSITQEPNLLVVSGSKSTGENQQFLYRGLAGRAFQRRFELADHVRVAGASLENGLLMIDLKREVPEEMKPRKIAIGKSLSGTETRQIASDKKAA